jgi:hypothetical protein
MKCAKERRPLDYDGLVLVIGDRVKSTRLGMPGESGEVVGLAGSCIEVRLDKSHVTWKVAASLWRKIQTPRLSP